MHFVPIDRCGKYSLANQLWGKEWEFGRPVSGLVIGNKEGICGSYLRHMETGGSLLVDVFQNIKAEANSLTFTTSQECRAQVQFDIFRACSQPC